MSDIITDKNTPTTNTTTTNSAIGHDHQRLFYLHDLENFKVHHDDTDIRGWKVKLSTGEVIGNVENLIVDKAARKVRYIEVTDDKALRAKYKDQGYYLDKDSNRVHDANTDSHFMVPIAMARLDHSDNEVYVEGVSMPRVGGIPRYRRGSELKPRYEIETLNYYSDDDHDYKTGYDRNKYKDFDQKYRSMGDPFYTSGYFNDERYYDRHREATTSKGL